MGCARDATTTFPKDVEEVEESTIKRRTQTAANPIETRLTQKFQELKKRVSEAPNRRKPNHNKSENIESAAQRLVL